jgi:acetyltransferase-like isoleucine patch superfamily enzyme
MNIFKKAYRGARSLIGPNKIKDFGRDNGVTAQDAVFTGCQIQFLGDNNQITIEPGARFTNLEIHVVGSGNTLRIASGTNFQKGWMWIGSHRGAVHVGANTLITDAALTITEPDMSISIGRDCLFSWKIDIRCGDGHPIIDVESGRKINPARPIEIGDHVWLGADVQILKGVRIGTGSIVGTRSLVTKDIPPNALAAGAPARVLRTGVSWTRENHLDIPVESLDTPWKD